MKNILLIPAAFVLILSCQKEITVELPDPQKKIVVDGGVFAGELVEINLTWSTGYFDPVDSASLASYLITNALVTISDGISTDTMTLGFNPNKPIPIVWRSTTITGQVGRSYVLNVLADGKSCSSVTTIPAPIPLDSVWFKVEPDQDSLGFAWAHLTDPAGTQNAYRWFAKRTSDPDFLAPFGSAFDDRFIEGSSFDFAYNRPAPPNSTAPEDHNNQRYFYQIGDTIIVRFCTIGKAEADFFHTFEVEVSNNGNPFAAPGLIKTNVNGGLGVFCGYSPSYDTIICQ
ncbi:MAG TPA: DUF4249 domain-containing protein [Bacteroidia bacterium]|nr:DUF4249 domain-containing protein [Bacteroidia bacterium]